MGVKEQLLQEEEEEKGVVAVNPKPKKGLVSATVDLIERVIVYLMHDRKTPLHYLAGNFAPVRDETPPCTDLPVRGTLPVSRFPNLIRLISVCCCFLFVSCLDFLGHLNLLYFCKILVWLWI